MPRGRIERLRAQVTAWRAEQARSGTRHATVHSVRRLLDLGPVTTGRVELITGQIDELRGRLTHDELETSERLEVTAREAAVAMASAATTATAALAAATEAGVSAEATRATAALFERVWTTTAWIESMHVDDDVLVSVVLPTRGMRPDRLRRAVDSVLRQTYERWELLVAVDGAVETVEEVGAQLMHDDRVHVVRSSRPGVSAARNTALEVANGDIVAYLDDDNLMGPLWLKAVVATAAQEPDAEVFIGAQLVASGAERGLSGAGPVLWLEPFDRRRLRRGNYIDQGAIAHRRGVAEAHYDESLSANVDWDVLLRLTAHRDPVLLPVIAGHYATDAPDRLTGSPDAARSWEAVSARARSMTPLRVLALNAMYPLITETYIGDELDALSAAGAEIACCVMGKRTAPARSPYPLYHDPAQAVAEHEPDLVLLHWAGVGLNSRPLLHELGVPYAVRGHSFAEEPDLIPELVKDPLCVGVWCFPHHATDHPAIHPLPVVFTSHDRLPPPASERDLVLSTSSGLPKKDFPLLVEAFGALPGVDRRIVVGVTAEHESVVTDLILIAQELEDPPLVQSNLTRQQVFELLARTTALVYTLASEAGFGYPMSVVEAMTAGVCVVLPDREEVHKIFGPDVRTYSTAEDIVNHVRTILQGGPDIDAERDRLRMWALEHFCDPETGKRFYAELADAVASWRGSG